MGPERDCPAYCFVGHHTDGKCASGFSPFTPRTFPNIRHSNVNFNASPVFIFFVTLVQFTKFWFRYVGGGDDPTHPHSPPPYTPTSLEYTQGPI